jgi:hypothetical protein
MNPEMRIGDAEREAAVAALGEHYAAGRLTKDEFDERSERAYAARTTAELHPLFGDLPGATTRSSAGPARSARAHPGWRARGWLAPVAMIVIALVVLTHLPLLLLILVGWFCFARMGRSWVRRGRSCGPGSPHAYR